MRYELRRILYYSMFLEKCQMENWKIGAQFVRAVNNFSCCVVMCPEPTEIQIYEMIYLIIFFHPR